MTAPTVSKPSRSDDLLDETQQLLIYNQVRSQFDSLAPKRPLKPCRSEPGSVSPSISIQDQEISVPELVKLRSLQHQSQVIFSEDTKLEQEEFVENDYYDAFDSIDKQHHKTGSGFIKVAGDDKTEDGYDLRLGHEENGICRQAFHSNPATNDWIPKFEDYQGQFVSSKPNRSESS